MRHQLAAIIFTCGAALKACLIALFESGGLPQVLPAITTYDPLAVYLANAVVSLSFDQKGIAPGPGASELFNAVLVIVFGLECALAFYCAEWLSHVKRRAGQRHPV